MLRQEMEFEMSRKGVPENTPRLGRSKRALYFTAGTVSLGVGVLGMVLPVLPTTPLLLLALACYCRSSERMYRWMLTNRFFGRHLDNYRAGRGMPLKFKAFTLALLWLAIGYTAFFSVGSPVVQAVLLAIAAIVTLHIATIPTLARGKRLPME